MKTTTAPPDRLPICCVWLLRSTGSIVFAFTTSHPIEFTDDIIEVYRDTPELVSFLHLPVQSGSDRILNLMGRTHTALEYKAIIRKLRAARPDIQISSDFIVGFPGETTEDFEKTMKLIADVNFDMSYSFIFSARPGTPAADMVDDVPEEEKKQRLYILQERINQQAMAWSRRMLGTTQRILVEGTSRKSIMELSGAYRKITAWSTSRAHRI